MNFTLKISEEKAKEIPMVDLAFEILKSTNEPAYYRDIMQEIAKIKGFSEDDVMQVIAQLYTEINIDGRFACVGKNLWGLKRWYPVDKSEDGLTSVPRPRIINDEDDDDDFDDSDNDNDGDFDSFDEDDNDDGEEEEEEFYEDDDMEEEEIDEEIDEELDDEDMEEDLDDEDLEDQDEEETDSDDEDFDR